MSWQLVGSAAVKDASEDVVSLREDLSTLRRDLENIVRNVSTGIESAVAKAVASIPKPVDGRDGTNGIDGASVTVSDVAPLVAAEVERRVATLPVAKDGIGIVSALVDRKGELVLTLSDGTSKSVGVVVGKDADVELMQRSIREQLAEWPRPKDGKHGQDGLGFDDMEEELDADGRTVIRRYRAGERVKEFRHTFGVVLDRGVFKAGQVYQKGDGVTWGGSWWIAQADVSAKPGENGMESRKWRLAVQRGRDGATGKEGPVGPSGPRGEIGPQGPRGY